VLVPLLLLGDTSIEDRGRELNEARTYKGGNGGSDKSSKPAKVPRLLKQLAISEPEATFGLKAPEAANGE